jgi:hypothetical protein
VEFGMLIARGEFGNAKYPTKEAIIKMLDYRDSVEGKKQPSFLLSCHICNDWAKELVEGSNGNVISSIPMIYNI